ncbi:uncharacterized protein LOC102412770 [Bubalus bubalis]|uniref:uncharacterized protein LOC102412770 n=1 Tax=Bubalus bubalis TaxID=89462 RepID=UPI001D0FE13E|nr:uncharacterized protein LOC102412770 [Bubalus bubalis]
MGGGGCHLPWPLGGHSRGAGSRVPTEKTRGGRAWAEEEQGPRGRGQLALVPRVATRALSPRRLGSPSRRASLPGARGPREQAAGGYWAEAHGRLSGGSGFCAAPRPELLSERQVAPAPPGICIPGSPPPAAAEAGGAGQLGSPCRARGRRIRFLRVLARSPNPDRLGLGTGGILESIRRGSQPRDGAERKTGRNTGGAGDPDTCPPCVSPLSTPSLDSNRGPCLKGDHQETELTCLLVSGKRHDRGERMLKKFQCVPECGLPLAT